MIEPKNKKLSISRQCKILGVNRSSYYYRPKPIKQEDLDLMRKIDELYLENPSFGSLFTGWTVSGIEMARARFGLLCGTARTCVVMLRETVKRSNLKTQSTDAQRRGGPTRSSVEGSVMDLEPRSRVVLSKLSSTRKGRNE